MDGGYRNYSYSPSPQDDWTLDESMRFRRSFDLKESFLLPCPANKIGDSESTRYEFNEAGVAAIKGQLLRKRGGHFERRSISRSALRRRGMQLRSQ